MSILLVLLIAVLGAYLSNIVNSLVLSRMVIIISLISLGFFLSNPVVGSLISIILFFSRTIYTPAKDDPLIDIKCYLLNKALLKSQTYLMLLFTGGFFTGLILPAIKNYPLPISIFTFLIVFLVYIVEYSNMKSFEEKIKKARQDSDPIEALRYAFELMLPPFKEINSEEMIKNRLEFWKNVQQKRKSKQSH
ncbi:MAG: hypothetical protein ACP5KD_07495 [Fervidobacterium sp.]